MHIFKWTGNKSICTCDWKDKLLVILYRGTISSKWQATTNQRGTTAWVSVGFVMKAL